MHSVLFGAKLVSIMDLVPMNSVASLVRRSTRMSSVVIFVLFWTVYLSFIPSAFSQLDFEWDRRCRTYCQTSICERAYYLSVPQDCGYCSCTKVVGTAQKQNNSIMIAVLAVALIVFAILAAICSQLCKLIKKQLSSPSPRPSFVVAPVPHAVIGAISGSRRSSNINSSSAPLPHAVVGAISGSRRSSNIQISSGGYVNPLAPQKSNDYPPEYLAPPPYNECVIDVDTPTQQEKS